MIDLRLRPNTQCFNVVIRALVDAGQLEEVSTLAEQNECVSAVRAFALVCARRG